MDNAELVQLLARLKRTFPRQPDVLAVCDVVEGMMKTVRQLLDAQALRSDPSGLSGPKRDRAAYMRDYRSGKRKRA